MGLIKFDFYVDDNDFSPDELAFGAFRWFMNHAELTEPELTVFYKDCGQSTFYSNDFFPVPSPAIRSEEAVAFIMVGSMDQEDQERVVVAYPVGSQLMTISFPTIPKMNARAKRLMKRFRSAMPTIQEIKIVP